MSEVKWTKEQFAAITEKNCNLLVAAAAGAGKTAVLVERIIRKITDEKNPVDIDSLLVVTFTNAAATEMRERIGNAISKAIEENRESKNMHRQLSLINKASITTIHSFCLEVIRSNFQSIDIDPKFRILDETEAVLLKSEVLNELFEDLYDDEGNYADYFNLLETYGTNRDDQKIQDMVLNIFGFIQSYPWPDQWLENQARSFDLEPGDDFAGTCWGRILLEASKIRMEGLLSMMETACSKLQFAQGLEKYLPVFIDDTENLKKLISSFCTENPKWNDIYVSLRNWEFENLPRCSGDTDRKLQEDAKKVREELKTFIRSLKEEVFSQRSEEIIADLKEMYPVLKFVAGLVSEFSRRYAQKKNHKAAVDFNDLEHFTLKILTETGEDGNICSSKVAQAYKEKFSEILVDEYQDSNLIQEIIIKMISREDWETPNVFMVGDVKQSIYRFRQARPELFLEKYNNYSSKENSLYRKILLFNNFRSRKEVIDGVNFIFKQIMSESVGELDYSDIEKLNPGAGYPEVNEENRLAGGEVELHLIETSGPVESDDIESPEEEISEEDANTGENEDEILDNLQKEARMVASRIIELLQPDGDGNRFSVYDKKINGYRDLQFKDIVILLRTTKNWTDIFSEELSRASIPVFADTGSGFFKTPEIQVFLSLLQIIDNPCQDIPLLSVLRSPIGNFGTDDLAELRLADRNASLFDALKILADNEKETGIKAKRFLDSLDNWRRLSQYMPTHKLIWQLYNDTGYFSIVGAMHDGERKQANLRVLFERALQFENTSYKGLFNFINFIDKLKINKGDMGSAKILGENDNVVRLMSIHKSKGLEFPVVFLCGCGKKFNFQDMYKDILLHQELGFGPDFVDYKKRIKYPSVPKLAIAQKLKLETLSEEMRILYVAMTRAREKLILTGAVANLAKTADRWLSTSNYSKDKFPAHDMIKARNYLDWICPSVMRSEKADMLREAAGIGAEYNRTCIEDQSDWRIFLWKQEDIASVKKLEDENQQADIQEWLEKNTQPDIDRRNEIIGRLNWQYKYSDFSGIPSKISVTEIKRYFKINEEDENPAVFKNSNIKKPLFLQEKKGLSPSEKGTVMHFAMQHLNLSNDNIKEQIDRMVEKELITVQQAGSIDIRKIEVFLRSEICSRMVNSGKMFREVPFNMELSCKELYPELNIISESVSADDLQDKILLQGVIDCYFQEGDKIILLDYKTDYIAGDNIDAAAEKYKLQLSYYSRALELLTGLKVSEKYIYLFSSGSLIAM